MGAWLQEKQHVTHVNVKGKIAGRDLILETGSWAKQSDGSIIATYGGTKVMAMANRAKAREVRPPETDDPDYLSLVALLSKPSGRRNKNRQNHS